MRPTNRTPKRSMPPGAIPPQELAVLVACLRGESSVRGIGRACGWESPYTANYWVKAAIARGLVEQNRRPNGTARWAEIRPVPIRIVASERGVDNESA